LQGRAFHVRAFLVRAFLHSSTKLSLQLFFHLAHTPTSHPQQLPPPKASDTTMKCRASDVFKDYFDDPTLSDLTIRLSDRSIHVHRIVLCRKSEYFNSMLTGNFQVHTS
jgi:hypothetical protein